MPEAVQVESAVPESAVTQPEPKRQGIQRILSLDAFRGLVMVLMLNERTHLPEVARSFPHSAIWALIAYNTDHVEWQGCSVHDLIQPAFSFLVGAALPFSIAARKMKGETFGQMLGHAIRRAFILIFLGIFLRSLWSRQTYFTFEDTLTQIGLGYVFLFLFGFTRVRTQVIAFVLILICFWAAFALYPAPGPHFDYPAVGVPQNWDHNYTGFLSHWNKNSNLSWAFDKWFLNLFPREHPFRLQPRRMVHPEFHSDARDHDSRTPHGRMAQSARLKRTKSARARRCGSGLVVRWACVPMGRHLSNREARLDLFLHPL